MFKKYSLFTAIFIFSAFLLGLVYYFYYCDPVLFAKLITEDHIVEFYTSICFFFSAVLFVITLINNIKSPAKYMLILMVLACLFISGEEISWGKRIFELEVPESLKNINTQEDLTLHNIEVVRSLNIQDNLSILILAWMLVSIFIPVRKSLLIDKLKKIGIPFIPIYLTPIFFLSPFFILFQKGVFKEFSEMFLSLAVFSYSLHLYYELKLQSSKYLFKYSSVFFGMLIIMLIISIWVVSMLSEKNDHRIKRRLNLMASTQYPLEGLYKQSFQIFNYIYSKPKYMTDDTVLNHGKLLYKKGKTQEVKELINKFVSFDKAGSKTDFNSSKDLRRLALLHKFTGDLNKSDSLFDRAIDIDMKGFENAVGSDEKALFLYSIAKTYEAKDDYVNAIKQARAAEDISDSAKLRRTIYRQIRIWKKEMRNSQQDPQ